MLKLYEIKFFYKCIWYLDSFECFFCFVFKGKWGLGYIWYIWIGNIWFGISFFIYVKNEGCFCFIFYFSFFLFDENVFDN